MDYSMKPSPDTPEPVDDEEDEMTLDPERSYSNRAASRKFGHHLSNSTGDLNIPPGGASSYPQLMHTFDMLPSYTRGILPAPAHQPAPPPPPPPLHDFRSAGYHHPHHHPHPNQHHAHQHPLNNTAPARRSGEYLPSYIGGGVRLNGGGTATDHLPIDGRLHGVSAPSGGGPTCGGGGDSYSSVLGGDLMTNNMTGGGALGLTSLHLVPPPPQSLSSRESSRCSDSPSDEPRSSPTSSSGGLTEQTQGLAIQDDSVHTSTQLKTRPKPISKNDKSKTCLVCGDHALGYNFNAITCESCKAFFRRNAYKNIRGRCEGTCVVTIETRSYCKRCRLAKCFAVGMRKDLILNDQQKQQRRQKIHDNRLRKMGIQVTPMPHDDLASCKDSADDIQIKKEEPVYTHCIAQEADDQSYSGLNDHSRAVIDEVRNAFAASFDKPPDKEPMTNPTDNKDFLNMAEVSVSRCVTMAKNLKLFKDLEQQDKIELLKGSVLEVLILRSVKMYDHRAMGWKLNIGDKPRTVSDHAMKHSNQESASFFSQYQHFASRFMSTIKGDAVVLMLVMVMTVLSPDREKIQNKEAVSDAQETYANVLREYINHTYPHDRKMFAKVLQELAEIRELDQSHTRVLMQVKGDGDIAPLVVEIFELDNR